ncbi:MAG: hypothetical protein KGJ60_02560 [Verrucomicrobiota bacterium]|nr:hypothetical protein [Verrucomicrobiota bacterium]
MVKSLSAKTKPDSSDLEYKKRGVDKLRAHEKEIARLAEDEAGQAEEESE